MSGIDTETDRAQSMKKSLLKLAQMKTFSDIKDPVE
jgi:hypothetical protein